jgi:hypothetical protein
MRKCVGLMAATKDPKTEVDAMLVLATSDFSAKRKPPSICLSLEKYTVPAQSETPVRDYAALGVLFIMPSGI